jgi:hypothetical protein
VPTKIMIRQLELTYGMEASSEPFRAPEHGQLLKPRRPSTQTGLDKQACASNRCVTHHKESIEHVQ